MMNRRISFLSVFFSFVTVLETQAEIIASGNDCAADDEQSNCHWELDSSGKLNITGSGAMKEYTEHNTNHGQPWFQYAGFINEVDIQGLSSISAQAFDGFAKINKVTMSDSVESIGKYAFRNSPITSLDLSENVTSIERYAFQDNKLTTLEIPDSLNTLIDGAFYSETLQTVIVPSNIISMETEVFGRNLENLKDMNIICKGENCDALKGMLKDYRYVSEATHSYGTTSILLDHLIIADEDEDGKIIAYDADGNKIGEYDSFTSMLLSKSKPKPSFTAGRGKRIYTIKEANEVAGKKNTVMIRYK